jgi:hypothetical protein
LKEGKKFNMNTLTRSILVVAFFAMITLSILLISGTLTGNMDHRWNMAIDGMRETKWIIAPLIVTIGIGFIFSWLIFRSKKLHKQP